MPGAVRYVASFRDFAVGCRLPAVRQQLFKTIDGVGQQVSAGPNGINLTEFV